MSIALKLNLSFVSLNAFLIRAKFIFESRKRINQLPVIVVICNHDSYTEKTFSFDHST